MLGEGVERGGSTGGLEMVAGGMGSVTIGLASLSRLPLHARLTHFSASVMKSRDRD